MGDFRHAVAAEEAQGEEEAFVGAEGPEREQRVVRLVLGREAIEEIALGDDQEAFGRPAAFVGFDGVAQSPGEEAEEVAREGAGAGPTGDEADEDEERFLAEIGELADGEFLAAPGGEEAGDLAAEEAVEFVARGGVGATGAGEGVEVGFDGGREVEVPRESSR